MRLLVGGIMHETHTFSVEPTTLDSLDIYRGDEILHFAGTNHSVGGTIDECRRLGIDLTPTFVALGVSTGTPDQVTFDALLDELCGSIQTSLPADGIVLNLHGAMVAEGFPDAEAEIVTRVRHVAGDEIPIAVTLDFHANIGQRMVDQATVVTTYDTYPHVDAGDRAREAVQLLSRTIRGEIQPVMALVKPPLLPVPQAMATAAEPYRTVFEAAHRYEDDGKALSITVAGGFAYSDVPEAGVSVIVTTDADLADLEEAKTIANVLATMLWDARESLIVSNVDPSVAVAQAIESDERPTVLVDVGDNIGGGTPGDGTVILAELIRQNAEEATIVINDPESVAIAVTAGIGANVDLLVGGKTDDLHGNPVPVHGTVKQITDGHWIHEGPENAGVPVDSGPSVLLQSKGVNLVLTSHKTMPGDLQQLRSMGIEPSQQRILVVKAVVRWRGGYEPIVKRAILVDTPGLGSADLTRFTFRHLNRPIYPLDQDTTWAGR